MADSIDQAFEEAYNELGIGDILDEDGPAEEPEQPEDDSTDEEPAEGDEEGPEAPAEDDEDSEDEDGESDEDRPAVIEITEGATIRLPDGTEVPAEKAVLFQQAFTRKTQELAEQRKEFEQERDSFTEVQTQVEATYEQMRDWYEERVSNPSDWVMEIALESGDATRTVAKAIYELGRAGKLDPRFVEAFGIEEGPVAETANDAEKDAEIAELKQWREQQEAEREAERHKQALVTQYQSQWEDIKLSHGLELSGAQETQAKRELMEFAVKKRLTHDLADAYVLMQASKQVQTPGPASTPDPAVTEQKRALKAVNPRSSGSGSARSQQKQPPKDTRSAALDAIAELGL